MEWSVNDVNQAESSSKVSVRRGDSLGRIGLDFPSHQQLCDKMDKQLFLQILDNHTHVLHQLLPPRKDTQHSLRPRAHNRIIPPADAKFKRNLIIRMLYLNSYWTVLHEQ